MSRARQTPESLRIDFDRIAPLCEDGWNHNAQYHEFLLGHVPARCAEALEIGCGTGGFSRLLAARAAKVLAIDLSPRMIRLARERSALHANVEFVEGDVMSQSLTAGRFDCVATLTTLHHLPAVRALVKIRETLRPGGVFLCLDLYQRSTFSDLIFDAAAYPLSPLLRLLKAGRLKPSREVREAYAEHAKTDTYMTLPEVERVCAEVMPGARVRRHLFWRYSIVWTKPRA